MLESRLTGALAGVLCGSELLAGTWAETKSDLVRFNNLRLRPKEMPQQVELRTCEMILAKK
jgi:hypothetical protein